MSAPRELRFATTLRPDPPLVQDASFKLSPAVLQALDGQVITTQTFVSENLLRSVHGTYIKVTGGDASKGDVMCSANGQAGEPTITIATTLALSTAGAVIGVLTQDVASGSLGRVAIGGMLSPEVTGLAADDPGWVRVDGDGRCEKVDTLAYGDVAVGWVDEGGFLKVGALPSAVGAGVGTLSAETPIDVDNADPANPVVKWNPTTTVSMGGQAIASCTAVRNASGHIELDASGNVTIAGTSATTLLLGRVSGLTIRTPGLTNGRLALGSTGIWSSSAVSFAEVQTALAVASAAVTFNLQKLSSVGSPLVSTDAATKGYVDSIAAGLSVKASVRAATTANITLSGTQTIDDVALGVADEVLVKDQTDKTENGIYVVAAGAWTRRSDLAVGVAAGGTFCFVKEGTANHDKGYVCISDESADIVGTDDIEFTGFTGASAYTAGAGLTESPSGTFNVVAADSTITVSSDSIAVGSGSLTNTHINASAAIAGSKIDPTFGAQNISQSGATSITAGTAGVITPKVNAAGGTLTLADATATLTASGTTTSNFGTASATNNVGNSSATNTIAGTTVVDRPGTGVTTGAHALLVENTTAAANGAQQWVSIRLRANGWKTQSTAASKTTDYFFEVQSVQGFSAPTMTLRCFYHREGDSPGTAFYHDPYDGNLDSVFVADCFAIRSSSTLGYRFLTANNRGGLDINGSSWIRIKSYNQNGFVIETGEGTAGGAVERLSIDKDGNTVWKHNDGTTITTNFGTVGTRVDKLYEDDFSLAGGAGSTTVLTVALSSLTSFSAIATLEVTAADVSTGDTMIVVRKFKVNRHNSGALTCSSATDVAVVKDDASWDATLAASSTNLEVRVTGDGSNQTPGRVKLTLEYNTYTPS